jgi:hypothetical protein
MRAHVGAWSLACLLGAGFACAKPNSIELGGICQEQVECKAPADTCLTVGAQSRCSMPCTEETRCPDTFVCARMDIAIQQDGQTTSTARSGYCLPESAVPSNIAKL